MELLEAYPDSYRVVFRCSNFQSDESLRIRKGVSVADFIKGIECHNCGLKGTLVQKIKLL